MRLEDYMNLAQAAIFSGRKRGANLRGMMAVIIHHPHATHPALQLKTAVHAAKSLQALPNAVRVMIKSHAHGHRRGRIQHIVVPGTCR